ncbi:MAG: hypothetical protein Q8O70_01655 [Burkholderiales bacterium]|nr:hypothetical protein [Burkholderiales bacterium]
MRISKTAMLFIGALALPALAQTTPGIDKRQANQEKRIQQGVQSGQLTGKEAARLEKGQARIERTEQRAKADGVVTKKERARMQHQQNVQSRHIARAKHNARATTK